MALVDQLEAQLTTSRAAAQILMEAVVAELTNPDPIPLPKLTRPSIGLPRSVT